MDNNSSLSSSNNSKNNKIESCSVVTGEFGDPAVPLSSFEFWGGIRVFIEKPHILNRRVCGVKGSFWAGLGCGNSCDVRDGEKQSDEAETQQHMLSVIVSNTRSLLSEYETNSKICDNLINENDEKKCEEKIKQYLSKLGFSLHLKEDDVDIPWEDLAVDNSGLTFVVIVRTVLPKDTQRFTPALEIVILSLCSFEASVLSLQKAGQSPLLPTMPYSLLLKDGTLRLNGASDGQASGGQWLSQTVLPRVEKWCSQSGDAHSTASHSLANVDVQAYNALYWKLKRKYASYLIENWPEKTDPMKHIHEDIGIATYLLMQWEPLGKPQRFLDLGCGNGVLVYLLTKEGHPGRGYDIKRRKIWDLYGAEADLQEREVTPRDSSLDPTVDWLIGNHSDELTPWIPVMAARTSASCSFFVLPCCSHDFTAKYIRRRSGASQYGDYLEYVREVGEVCGFVMEQDRLRIASTKRVSFVGHKRTYSPENRPEVLAKIQSFINKRAALYNNNKASAASSESEYSNASIIDSIAVKTADQPWTEGFVARPKEQLVRNCTKLKQGVKEDLVQTVVRIILATQQDSSRWRTGERTPLSTIASSMSSSQLQQLKLQCGGLQTLLKNHWQIFLVQNGSVQLRTPKQRTTGEESHRECWFFIHHPQGCPNDTTTCYYRHPSTHLTAAALPNR